LFKPGSTRGLWEEFEAGRVSWSRVWSLFVLDEWTRLEFAARRQVQPRHRRIE
jgi:hypothetical protein